MAVAATGFFDGVHLGHREVLARMCAVARERGEESLVVSFWPHPRSVLQQDADKLRLLTSLDEKRALCRACGVDRFEVLPFTRAFSRVSTAQFIREYLVERFGVTTLVVGYDHRLGHDRFDSVEEMMEVIRACGVEPVCVEELDLPSGAEGVGAVSSTSIRKVLMQGGVEEAERMLGYRYGLRGVVVAGNRIGRTIGFPTANMQLYEPLKLVPAHGVYAVDVEVMDTWYRGVCNIGIRPTVGLGGGRTIETHILDFDEDIYGLDLEIRFRARLRDERKFDSLEALKVQLEADRKKVRELV